MRALCRSTLRAFMILTIAACKYILRSSSTALLVCSISWWSHRSVRHVFIPKTKQQLWNNTVKLCLTCGVSFCIEVVILNFVLLLVKFIFSENVDSISISSCDDRGRRMLGMTLRLSLRKTVVITGTFCESWLSILTSNRDLMVFWSSFSFIWVPSCSSLYVTVWLLLKAKSTAIW